ncbi:MAG TPA: DUF2975 domain-containing protein [Microbacteriaceae bacterium]|nr:DUF2975 domain-containing protein [Microbacteriaceae bacterium]
MSQVIIVFIRVFIGLIALGTLAAQVLVIPEFAAELGTVSDMPSASVPYAVAGIIVGACFEVALTATWMLVSMVSRDAIFTENAFRWVDAIIGASLTALALVVAFGAHAVFVLQPRLDSPSIELVVGATVICGATFVLLVIVLRGLLRNATNLRSELAEVI